MEMSRGEGVIQWHRQGKPTLLPTQDEGALAPNCSKAGVSQCLNLLQAPAATDQPDKPILVLP